MRHRNGAVPQLVSVVMVSVIDDWDQSININSHSIVWLNLDGPYSLNDELRTNKK